MVGRTGVHGKSGRRAGALVAVFAILAGCTVFQTEQPTPGEVVRAPLAPPAPNPQPEQPRVPPQVARSFGGAYSAPEIERRLSSMLARLVPVSDRPDLAYSVTILNSPSVNAFALPDGQLFVTRGLLAVANDDAEVASVVAHEMGHVSARHATQRVEQAQNAVLGSRVLSAVSRDPQAGQVALVAGAVSLASFSRAQELEADAIGIRTSFRAGYDPYGAVRLLEGMDRRAALRTALSGARDETGGQGSFLATHPSTPERMALAVSLARQLAGPDVGARDRDAYLRTIDGLLYGDDPRAGFVRGQTYLHPNFGFAFSAPDGFALENTPRAVIGVGDDGRAMRFDTIVVPPLTSLAEALQATATAELTIENVETGESNGFATATAIGRAPGWTFRFVLVRFGNDVYRFIFAARLLTPEHDAEFLTAARSFRRLAPEEVRSIRPARVRVVTVGQADTIEALAQRMSGTTDQLARFLALNGFERSTRLRPGMRVKIIAN